MPMIYSPKMQYKQANGFTLMEVMVATSLFIVVVMMSIQSLLAVSKANKLTQRVREQMDTLSFVMEDIVRNTRIGTLFHCFDNNNEPVDIAVPHSCPITNPAIGSQASFKIAFEGFDGDPANPGDQVVYWFAIDPADSKYYLYKSKNGDGAVTDSKFKKMTSALITIDPAKSGFTIFNAEQSNDISLPDTSQVRLLLRVTGTVEYQGHVSPFDLQTTVSPRKYDL